MRDGKLPEDWEEVRIGELGKLFNGGTPSTKIESYWDGNIPWVTGADINGLMISSGRKFITNEGLKNSATNIVPSKSVLIVTRTGVGKVAVSINEIAFSQDITALVCNDKIIPEFFARYISYISVQLISQQRGATIQGITRDILNNIKIPLPPIETQKNIVVILEKAEKIQHLQEEVEKNFDDLIRSIFIDMFGDPSINSMEWRKAFLHEICIENDGIKCGPFGTQLHKFDYIDSGIPVWGIKQVNSHFMKKAIDYITQEKAETLEEYSIISNDIVMTRKGTVGNCAIYPDGFPKGIMHSDTLRLRVKTDVINPLFLQMQFSLNLDAGHQISRISSGAVMAGINVTKLKHIKVLVPPITLQNQFYEIYKIFDCLKNKQMKEKESSLTLFYSLIQRAFKGELVH